MNSTLLSELATDAALSNGVLAMLESFWAIAEPYVTSWPVIIGLVVVLGVGLIKQMVKVAGVAIAVLLIVLALRYLGVDLGALT